MSRPPPIVIPEREIPGISAAAWAVPIASACLKLIFAMRRVGVPFVVAGLRRAAAEALEEQQQDAVEGEEDRRRLGRGEEVAQLVLERQAEDPGRDRADDDHPAEPGVGVAGPIGAPAQRAAEPAEDPLPVVEEEEEEDDRRGAVGGDQEGEEEFVVLVDVPAEQRGAITRVAEAGDRERLGDPLQGAEDDRLEVGDRFHRRATLFRFA